MFNYRMIIRKVVWLNAFCVSPLIFAQPRLEGSMFKDATHQTIIEGSISSDKIPRSVQLRYVFDHALSWHKYGKEDLPLSDNDIKLLEESSDLTNYISGPYNFLQAACDKYKKDGENADARSLGKILNDSNKLEEDAENEFLVAIYERLSAGGKSFIDEKIRGFGARNKTKIIKTDYESLGREKPEVVINMFKNSCAGLDATFEAYNGKGTVNSINMSPRK